MTVSLFSGSQFRDAGERVRGPGALLDRLSRRRPYTRSAHAALRLARRRDRDLPLAAAASRGRPRTAAPTRSGAYFSARHGVGVEAPPGWTLSQHTGYPTVLVRCSFTRAAAAISLAVDRTTAKDAAALAEQSRPGLVAQGLDRRPRRPGPRGGVLLDARAARRNQALRQLYIVRDLDGARGERQADRAHPDDRAADLAAASAAFDWVIAHLDLEAPVRPDDKPDATPTAAAERRSAGASWSARRR